MYATPLLCNHLDSILRGLSNSTLPTSIASIEINIRHHNGEEGYAGDYTPLSEECKRVKELWDEADFEGAPINLQICARRYHDNELFGALKVLKDALELP